MNAQDMLWFKVDQKAFAIPVENLVAAAGICPYIYYEGIPKSFCGVVQWGGKLIPILNLEFFKGVTAGGTQLKSQPQAKSGVGAFVFAEAMGRTIAFSIAGEAYVIHPTKFQTRNDLFFPATVINEEQQEASVIHLSKMLEKIRAA